MRGGIPTGPRADSLRGEEAGCVASTGNVVCGQRVPACAWWHTDYQNLEWNRWGL